MSFRVKFNSSSAPLRDQLTSSSTGHQRGFSNNTYAGSGFRKLTRKSFAGRVFNDTRAYGLSAMPTAVQTHNPGYSSISVPGTGWTRQLSETPVTAVTVNKSLLVPLNVEIDPTIQAVRSQEKQQIQVLNDRFASFIDKVRSLEQQNKILETKWSLLQKQTSVQSNIDDMFKAYISNLHRQLDILSNEKMKLEGYLYSTHDLVEDIKKKYEDEVSKRMECESDFILIKKDMDQAFINKAELEAKLDSLTDEVDILRLIYEEELRELQSQIKNTSVIVEMDNSRKLDMDAVVAEVNAQYEDIANRSRAEAETWYKAKYEEMHTSANRYGEDLRATRTQIAELNSNIHILTSKIGAIKGQCSNLEAQIAEAEERGEMAMNDANDRIKELEEALWRAKQDMAHQIREYQDLMNLKLALDIEIATYRKLLEGEEDRLANGIEAITISQQSSNYSSFPMDRMKKYSSGFSRFSSAGDGRGLDSFTSGSDSSYNMTQSQKNLIIKTIETSDGKVLSESSKVIGD
ncbi:keratin, type II cytoskeletal 8-like [Fundulus heteroclitus]|uniref:keratin, type II cytoskeletal 8-like n=1 Tax=Fundulus heteroclitus TaxID=8078 RepID=UPI00165C557F|nr:keratin, type II cytoskeletal 8-like [Fundulus heteroclitus]